MASSPDNDGTGQNYRMVRVRQARREGVREKSVLSRPLSFPPAQTRWIWAGLRCVLVPVSVGEKLLGRFQIAGREATVKACGVTVARPQGYSWAPHPTIGSW